MPSHDRTAATALDVLAEYFSSSAAAHPDLSDARTALDQVLYERFLGEREGVLPGVLYAAFRRWPGDGATREAVEAVLRAELAADAGFAGAVGARVDSVAVDAGADRADAAAKDAGAAADAAAASGPASDTAPDVEVPAEAAAPEEVLISAPPTTPVSAADPLASSAPTMVPTSAPPLLPPPRPRRRRRLPSRPSLPAAAVAAVLLFAASGTGITIAALSARAGGPGHYTFADDPTTNPLSDFTIFDWTTDSHGTVIGTFEAIDPTDPSNDFTETLTGHQEGKTLTFVVRATLTTPKSTLKGTVTHATLIFRPPPGTTGGGTLTYHKTTKTAFTKAVHTYEALHPTDIAV